jgi:hypothetical protein
MKSNHIERACLLTHFTAIAQVFPDDPYPVALIPLKRFDRACFRAGRWLALPADMGCINEGNRGVDVRMPVNFHTELCPSRIEASIVMRHTAHQLTHPAPRTFFCRHSYSTFQSTHSVMAFPIQSNGAVTTSQSVLFSQHARDILQIQRLQFLLLL